MRAALSSPGLIVKALIASLVAVPMAVLAATDAERDLQKIVQERNSAIAAAAEPINRRYRTALEQLLRRATQTGDVDTAVKIKEALQALDPKDPGGAVIGDPPASRIVNTTWLWWGSQTITFQNGGKVHWSEGQTWTWAPVDANTIKGKTSTGQPFTITFSPDFKTGTIQGAVDGETRRLQK